MEVSNDKQTIKQTNKTKQTDNCEIIPIFDAVAVAVCCYLFCCLCCYNMKRGKMCTADSRSITIMCQ